MIDTTMLRVHLQLPDVCNMRPECRGCSTAHQRAGRLLTPAQAQDWWQAITWLRGQHGRLHIVALWGEPTADPILMELLRRAARDNIVEIVSNLVDLGELENVPRRADCRLVASYHPHAWAGTEVFWERVMEARRLAWNVYYMLLVGYPGELESTVQDRDWFLEHGEQVAIMPFGGTLGRRLYPRDWSAADWAILAGDLERNWGRSDLMRPGTALRGMPCLAGSRYLWIGKDGKAQACYQPGSPVLGNVLQRDLRLLTEPMACPYPNCMCPDQWAYIVGKVPQTAE